MIYVIMNIILAVFCFWFAYFTDARTLSENSVAIVNHIFLAGITAIFMALNILAVIFIPNTLSTFTCKIVLFFVCCLIIQFSFYFFIYPKLIQSKIFFGLKIFLLFITALIIFFKIQKISISEISGLQIESKSVFNGKLAVFFPWKWMQCLSVFYLFILPVISALLMIFKLENKGKNLEFQHSLLNGLSVIILWIGLYLIHITTKVEPFYYFLLIYPFCVQVIFLAYLEIDSVIYDLNSIGNKILRGLITYAIPSIIIGFIYQQFHFVYKFFPVLFVIFFVILVCIVIIISFQISEQLLTNRIFKTGDYGPNLERELDSLDYKGDTADIANQFYEILTKNIGCTSIKILIDNGEGELATRFSSDGSILSVPVSSNMIDIILNSQKMIIFKSKLNDHLLELIRDDIEKLFEKSKTHAMIILHEGRRIVGMILLGIKNNGNIYTDYDYDIFDKLYSYFFVFGYYMKNIGNEEIVGTVNREIRMSSQIISSIQKNMDPIKNPKIDAGYSMVPAHDIGGEFIDLIRLNKRSHLFVIGNLSGKGISASMSMVILKSIIRTYLSETHDFKLLVEQVNTFIRDNLPKATMFSGLFGLIDFSTNTIYYINCGIPAMFLYTRSYNNVIEIQGSGKILGFAKDISKLIKIQKIQLGAGDIIFICTEGLINSHSLRGEKFGKERIQQVITSNLTYPANRIARFADNELQKFMSKEREDDVSILVFKYQDTIGK